MYKETKTRHETTCMVFNYTETITGFGKFSKTAKSSFEIISNLKH